MEWGGVEVGLDALPIIPGIGRDPISQTCNFCIYILPLSCLWQHNSFTAECDNHPILLQHPQTNIRNADLSKLTADNEKNILRKMVVAKTNTDNPIGGSSSIHVCLTSFDESTASSENSLLIKGIISNNDNGPNYAVRGLTDKILIKGLEWLGYSCNVTDKDDLQLLYLKQLETVPLTGSREEMKMWIKGRVWIGFKEFDLQNWLQFATKKDMRKFIIKNVALNTKIILHVVEGLHRVLALTAALVGECPGDATWMKEDMAKYTSNLENDTSVESKIVQQTKCQMTCHTANGEWTEEEIVKFFDRMNVMSAQVQHSNGMSDKHTTKHTLAILLKRIQRRIDRGKFCYLVENDNEVALGGASSPPGNIHSYEALRGLIAKSGLPADSNTMKKLEQSSDNVALMDISFIYVWMAYFEEVLLIELKALIDDYSLETVNHMTSSMGIENVTPKQLNNLFNNKVFPLTKKWDCFGIFGRGRTHYQSDLRHTRELGKKAGYTARLAEMLLLLRFAFYSAEAYTAVINFATSQTITTIQQESAGDDTNIDTLMMCVLQCIAGQVFVDRMLFKKAGFFDKRRVENYISETNNFQYGCTEAMDALFVVGALKDVLLYFGKLGNHPLVPLQGHALSEEMLDTGTIVAACTSGMRMAILGEEVRSNIHTFFAFSYVAFLYQLVVLDSELGEVFKPWCQDLLKRYFTSIGVDFEDLDSFGAQSVGGKRTHDLRRIESDGTFHHRKQCFTAPSSLCMGTVLPDPNSPNGWKLGLSQSSSFKTWLNFMFRSDAVTHIDLPLASEQNVTAAKELQAKEVQGVLELVQNRSVNKRSPGTAFSSPSQHSFTLSGLENPPTTNRCWLNALLISLVSLPGMFGWLSDFNYSYNLKDGIEPRQSITASLAAFGKYFNGVQGTKTALIFLEVLRCYHSFPGNEQNQNDVSEMLAAVTQTVEAETCLGSMDADDEAIECDVDSLNCHLDKETGPLGWATNYIEETIGTGKCNECGAERKFQTLEAKGYITLPISNNAKECTLDSLLKDHAAVKDRVLRCENPACCADVTLSTQATLFRHPLYLIVVLSKYNNDLTKNNVTVHTEMNGIDLSSFLGSTDGQEEEEDRLYDLVCVLNHDGESLGNGHVTAIVKEVASGNFYEYDDNCRTRIPENEVISSKNYVLFFCRKNFVDGSMEGEAIYKEDGDGSDIEGGGSEGGAMGEGDGNTAGQGGGDGGNNSGVLRTSNDPGKQHHIEKRSREPPPPKLRNPPGSSSAKNNMFKSGMELYEALRLSGIKGNNVDESDLSRVLCDTRAKNAFKSFLEDASKHYELFHRILAVEGEKGDEAPMEQELLDTSGGSKESQERGGGKENVDGGQSPRGGGGNSSNEEASCSEDEEYQSREKGTNNNNGRGANGTIRKRKRRPECNPFLDVEAECSGDSSISDESTGDNSGSDVSNLISLTPSEVIGKRRKDRRTRLTDTDTDDSSSRRGSTNGVGHDQITELNSPIRGADVAPGNCGALASPVVANKQDIFAARLLANEAEEEMMDDANRSTTSQGADSNEMQARVPGQLEEGAGVDAAAAVNAAGGILVEMAGSDQQQHNRHDSSEGSVNLTGRDLAEKRLLGNAATDEMPPDDSNDWVQENLDLKDNDSFDKMWEEYEMEDAD